MCVQKMGKYKYGLLLSALLGIPWESWNRPLGARGISVIEQDAEQGYFCSPKRSEENQTTTNQTCKKSDLGAGCGQAHLQSQLLRKLMQGVSSSKPA